VGYFDSLTNSYFKRTRDGRRLFFPWGWMGRGYVIPTENGFQKLHRAVKRYLRITFYLLMAVYAALAGAGAFYGAVLLPVLLVPYALWVRAKCRHMHRPTEKLTFEESIANQAREMSMLMLWSLEICSILFAIFGMIIFITGLRNRLIGLIGIFFFGFAAIIFVKMIVAKERQHIRHN